jgi:2-polyprenyl-6-methoxyphenol hydroxylase-like FAD-dependent oxidoreductase
MAHVLICGAGPVGLWLAAELGLRDVDVTVVDTRVERSPHSKALTIHPRTLELFADRGVMVPFFERGVKVPAGHFGALEQKLDMRALDTPFPFTLLFPQAETERVLEERAWAQGAVVRRGCTLENFVEESDCVRADVVGPDGQREQIVADILAGCDGAASTVRKIAGIGFPGTDATTFGILADVTLAAPPAVPLYSFSGVTGQVMVVPLPSGGYRIVAVDPSRQHAQRGTLDFDEFRNSVVRICGEDFGMHAPTWVSRYGNASRVAERYSSGRVVLAGDAAHMHFPAGGVGMNVGIQDAHGLGWRLADVVQGLAPRSILDDYHDERHAVGVDLVQGTQAQTAILAAFDPDRQALRALLNQLISALPALSDALTQRLSGLSVAYPVADGHPLVGRRLVIDAEAVRAGSALLLTPTPVMDSGVVRQAELARVASVVGTRSEVALVRPDGYVAWAAAADQATPAALSAALSAFRPLATAA